MQQPERYWIGQPDAHPSMTICGECMDELDRTKSVPVLTGSVGPFPVCYRCAVEKLAEVGTPQTAEYAKWLNDDDPRWWSAYLCTCTPCATLLNKQGGTNG